MEYTLIDEVLEQLKRPYPVIDVKKIIAALESAKSTDVVYSKGRRIKNPAPTVSFISN